MSEYAWRKLGADHGKIDSGKYTYSPGKGKRPEIIQWWTMDAASELELRLTDFANHVPNFHPSMIETVSSHSFHYRLRLFKIGVIVEHIVLTT